ncbi:MAG: hypothetical protein AAF081_10405 [Actinomycetota bacterium]
MSATDTTQARWRTDRAMWLVSASFLVGIPALWWGYGTDIDTANVLRAGESVFDGDYQLSRPPGNLPYEVAAYVLDSVGGAPLVVLGSMLTAAAALWLLAALVRHERRDPIPTLAVVAVSPWWWIASTSTGDYLVAVALVLGGARARLAERNLVAGACFGLAIGVRASTVGLVAAWLVAELVGDRTRLPALIRTGLATALIGALCFVPAWLAADRSFAFFTTETQVTNLTTLVGRWGVKNLAFWGPVTLVALGAWFVSHATSLRGAWRDSVMVRFALLGLVWAELVYLRFPWKPLHLLPALVFVAVLVGRTDRRLAAVVAAGLALNAVVTMTVAAPDVPHQATTGEIDIELRRGVLITDVECRFEDDDLGPWPPIGSTEAYDRSFAIFDCQAQLWRSGDRAPTGPGDTLGQMPGTGERNGAD